ncbi:MAG: hypothetical protein HYU67_05985 [Flavobacteriia bacterium]|nr:hypothetical protein [Flavobacteriia bacterium]
MKKLLYIFVFIASNGYFFSQNIGINATGATPDASAGLDVDFTNKGLLIPRVALTGTGDIVTLTGAPYITSTLVYNTATAGASPNNVTPGYYYWNGVKWVAFTGPSSNDWSLLGNAGTSAATNFIGTNDAVDWVMKTNNTERARILSNGLMGIGTSTPVSNVHLNGNMVWGNGTNAASVGGVLSTDQGGCIQLGGLDATANPVAGGSPYFDWKYGNGLIQDYNVRIINDADEKLSFYTLTSFPYAGGVPLMTLKQNKVGIGLAAPTAVLDVAGTFKLGTAGDVSTALKRGTFTVNIPSTANATAGTTTATVTGAVVGDIVIVQPPSTMDNKFVLIGCTVTAGNTVTISFRNLDTAGGADDPVACDWSYILVRP